MQDLSDRRKNWILLTPAEILGATTPEKILGIQEHDAAGQPKNSTAMERYTERQNQMLLANTNAFQNGDSSPAWDFSRNRRNLSDIFNPINGGLENPASGEPAAQFRAGQPNIGRAKPKRRPVKIVRCTNAVAGPKRGAAVEPGAVQTIARVKSVTCSGGNPFIK